ncbi:hypothetical protein DAPPUDRAFT_268093 [Daphnia pulex]|uniref:Uncharacterized protein n=1 Tax=Daphnia pulex TaxID=6669 RepID=E9HX98_DAPPU|nr:hypothetical protein DAPPUDRAFT_268093 [Daphnia pulex]|eukprot:EFX63635.1 hypothetical protein DAPPUDRAFT_268093 [Daphnia pulex]
MDELCVTEMNGRFITSDDIRMECGKSKASPKNGIDATGTRRVGSAPNPPSGCFYDDISNIKVSCRL